MSRIKLTATPSTRIAAITAKMIVPIPPVDGRRDPVLFSIVTILLSIFFPSASLRVHWFASTASVPVWTAAPDGH